MFGKKGQPDSGEKAKQAEVNAEKVKPSLRLRKRGDFLKKDDKETPDPNRQAEAQASEPSLGRKCKTKLHLMTSHEETERAFRAAREHYLSKNLPSIKRVRERKEFKKELQFVWDRFVAVVGFFLIVLGLIWLYNNYDYIASWWENIIKKIDSF